MRKLTFVLLVFALLSGACTGGVGAANVASLPQAEQNLQNRETLKTPSPFAPATLVPLPTFEAEPDLPGNDLRLFALEQDLGGELAGGDITLDVEDIPTYPNDKVIVEYVVTGYEGNYGQDYFVASSDSVGNPSVAEIVAYAKASQKAHQTPWEVMLSSCKIESGLRHYREDGQLTQGYNRDAAGNLKSTDWGMCQINDYWHPNLMSMAKGTWQENLNAGWAVMDACWTKNGNDPRSAYGCYNGSGPEGKYANIAMDALASRFWEEAEKQADSVQPKPGKVTNGKLISPVRAYCVTMRFGQKYPAGTSGVGWNLSGSVHGNGADLGVRNAGGEKDFTAYAPTDVEVIATGWGDDVGNYIKFREIGNPERIHSFWHLASISVSSGKVKAGKPLGVIGSTGYSTAAHLHWRIQINGVDVDPLQFIDIKESC